jgi:beta-mannanase
LKEDEQSKKRNELVNKKLKMKELSSRILLKKRKNENRDFIIDEMIKMKKSKREFLEVSIKERECEFLEISTEE